MHPRWREVTPTDADVASMENMLGTGGILETHEKNPGVQGLMTRSLEKHNGFSDRYCEIQNGFSAATDVFGRHFQNQF